MSSEMINTSQTCVKKDEKKTLVRMIALACILASLIALAGAVIASIVSESESADDGDGGIYVDGAKAVDFRGATYTVDEKGNVWEESEHSIRLASSGINASLLAVYDDTLYALSENDGEYIVSELSHTSGKLSHSISLGKEKIDSFSVAKTGFYCMSDNKIFFASEKNTDEIVEIVDISSLTYECKDADCHEDETASPSNAEFFTLCGDKDRDALILYTENPSYIDESTPDGETAEVLGENSKYISYLYNIENGELSLYSDNDVERSASTIASTDEIILNGVTVPFEKYPPYASYFTKNGKACDCHNLNKCLNNAPPCNCLRYVKIDGKTFDLAATQCFGFARYCQRMIFGYTDLSSSKFTNILGGKWKAGTFTASKLQDVLLENGAGGHIRMNGHSLFIISVDATGFVTYECNTVDKDCLVYTRTWTWASFYNVAKSKGIDYINMPKAFTNKVDVSYPTGDYLIDADGGLNLRAAATTSSERLANIPDGTIITITETTKIDGATVNAWWGKTTYNGKTGWVSLDYAKLQTQISGIKITKLPDRTTFYQNETFSYDGLVVQLVYTSGAVGTLPGGYTVKAPDMTKTGTHNVTVTYGSFEAKYEITIENAIVLPTKIEFDRPTITVMTGGEFIPAVGIDYKVLPSNADDKTVEWSIVSGDHLISINKNTGTVTAAKASSSFVEGYATVRATSLAEDEKGNRVNVYSEYTVEVIKASSDGAWSQAATNIPDGVSLSDYIIEYCATEADFNKGNWKTYTGSESGNIYKYRFKDSYKITWYYGVDSGDGSIELPSSFGYPSSVGIGERVSISSLKAVTRTNCLFAGWFTSAESARDLNVKYAYKGGAINSDTEFFAGWIDLESEAFRVNAAENDPVHAPGDSLPGFGLFKTDINISDTDGGLRFYGHISSALAKKLSSLKSVEVEYGMVVQLADKVGDELRSSNPNGYIYQGHSIVVTSETNYGSYRFMSGNSYTVFTTLATNIPLENAKTEIAARAFIVYYDANGIRRAFYFTNTKENTNTEDFSLVGYGAATSIYKCAERIFPTATTEQKNWLLENVLGYGYDPLSKKR